MRVAIANYASPGHMVSELTQGELDEMDQDAMADALIEYAEPVVAGVFVDITDSAIESMKAEVEKTYGRDGAWSENEPGKNSRSFTYTKDGHVTAVLVFMMYEVIE